MNNTNKQSEDKIRKAAEAFTKLNFASAKFDKQSKANKERLDKEPAIKPELDKQLGGGECPCHCHLLLKTRRGLEIDCLCIKNCIHCNPDHFVGVNKMISNPPQEESWETRFDEYYEGNIELHQWRAIKSFIRTELAAQREEVAREIIEDLEKIKYVPETKELQIYTVNPLILEIKVKYLKENKE